jgi:hypothetical protein
MNHILLRSTYRYIVQNSKTKNLSFRNSVFERRDWFSSQFTTEREKKAQCKPKERKGSIQDNQKGSATMKFTSAIVGVLLAATAQSLVSADKGYYNSGIMNHGSDMEIYMPSMKMDKQRCEDIKIPMCRGIGYNLTKFPNSLNIETQDEAGLEVHQFYPLVEINCSEDLKFFLCSMYTPICIEDYHQPLPACRSVCERARKGCEPIMENYGFPWPEKMACENLPVHGVEGNLCMERPDAGEDQSKTETTSSNNKKHHGSTSTKKCPKGDRRCQQAMNANNELKGRDCACKCRHPLVPLSKESMWYNTTVAKVGSVNSCGIPCKGN